MPPLKSPLSFARRALAAVLAAAVLPAILPAEAQASPDARIETQLRPDFGLLLQPPLRRRHHYRPWRNRRPGFYDYGPGWGRDDYGAYGPPGRDVVFVDCASARDPNEVNRALRALRPGGTLILHAGGTACLDNVFIDKPVTIQSDAGRPFRAQRMTTEGWDSNRRRRNWQETVAIPAALKSRPGGPCIAVEVSSALQGEVVLRDLVIEATDAGEEACLYIRNSHVRLERTVIRYAGEGSAVYIDGGSLTAEDDVRIDADTWDRGVYAEDAVIDFEDVTITRAAIGLDIKPTGNRDSRLRRVLINYPKPAAAPQFNTPTIGVVVSGSRSAGRLRIDQSKLCGFGVGLWVEGANVVDLSRSHICRAAKGVVASGGQTTLSYNTIGGNLFGLQVQAGQTILNRNRFYGSRYYEVYVEPGGPQPRGNGNRYYSSSQVCAWSRVDDRYWNGDGRSSRRYRNDYRNRMYMPGGSGAYYRCEDPSGFDRSYLSYDQELGYDDSSSFYGMDAWPRERVSPPYDRYSPDGYRSDPAYDSQGYDDQGYDSGYGDGGGYAPDSYPETAPPAADGPGDNTPR